VREKIRRPYVTRGEIMVWHFFILHHFASESKQKKREYPEPTKLNFVFIFITEYLIFVTYKDSY
jgi:hypothetical protein